MGSSPDAVRGANDVMQAVLFTEILKPLTAALGPVGDAALGSVVGHVFAGPRP